MKQWYASKELLTCGGLPGTVYGLLKRADRESWRWRPRQGRGGGKEFFYASLPRAAQIVLAQRYSQQCWLAEAGVDESLMAVHRLEEQEEKVQAKDQRRGTQALYSTERGGKHQDRGQDSTDPSMYSAEALPDPQGKVSRLTADDPAPYIYNQTSVQSVALNSTVPLSPSMRQKVRDKADLLVLYVQALDAAPWGEKVRARYKFTAAFNSGLAWPELHRRLGDVHWKTLEAWLVKLKRGQRQTAANAPRALDCFLLADRRGLHRRGQCAITEEQADIFLRCVLRPNRPRISEAYRLAQAVMQQRDIKNPHSEATWRRWLAKWRQQNHHIWVFAREGAKAWNDQCAMYIERDLDALGVGDVLVADGHALNFRIINPWTGKPQNHMVMVLFYDMAANMPLGWEIMASENTASITSALRRSLLMLGKVPKVVYLDNGRAFRAKFFRGEKNFQESGLVGLYARLGIRTIHAWPYHGQSKTVERFFSTFAELERLVPGYTGSGIATKPAYLQRGEKLHRQLHRQQGGEQCLTLEQAHVLIAAWFEAYSQRPQTGHLRGRCPAEMFAEGRGPGFDREELVWMMLAQEIKTIGRNGIRFQGRHYYHQSLHGRREKVRIRYDLQDLSVIWVEDLAGQLLCRADRLERVHPVAAHLGGPEDVERLRQAIAAKRAEEQRASATVRALLAEGGLPEAREPLRYLENFSVAADGDIPASDWQDADYTELPAVPLVGPLTPHDLLRAEVLPDHEQRLTRLAELKAEAEALENVEKLNDPAVPWPVEPWDVEVWDVGIGPDPRDIDFWKN